MRIGWFVDGAKDGEVGSLSWARAQADHLRGLARNGTDPREIRKAEAAAAQRKRANTYKALVGDYHCRYLVGEAGNASADDVRDTLLKEGAAWLDRRIDAIETEEIGALWEAIRDGGRPYLSNRVAQYQKHFFAWCAKPGVGYLVKSP